MVNSQRLKVTVNISVNVWYNKDVKLEYDKATIAI